MRHDRGDYSLSGEKTITGDKLVNWIRPTNQSHERYSKPEPKAMSMKEMDSVFRMALLSNLTFDEIVGLLPDVKGRTFHQVMNLMSQIDADRIITEIKKQVGENAA